MSQTDADNGRVVSVNLGKVRQIQLRGRDQGTGIYKEPVTGRVAARDHHLEGDVQADLRVHGGPAKAVYSYAAEDYRWWEEALDRQMPPGTFGENLTLEGVDVSNALIGERWRIGTVLLQVTQPRFPCWKLGVKMDDRHFPERFAIGGRPGAYLAIIEEGDLGAGDRIEVVERPDHPISVGLIAGLDHEDRGLAQILMQATQSDLSAEQWTELLSQIFPAPVEAGNG
jgi:MOSC domain-containing protein YiiM